MPLRVLEDGDKESDGFRALNRNHDGYLFQSVC